MKERRRVFFITCRKKPPIPKGKEKGPKILHIIDHKVPGAAIIINQRRGKRDAVIGDIVRGKRSISHLCLFKKKKERSPAPRERGVNLAKRRMQKKKGTMLKNIKRSRISLPKMGKKKNPRETPSRHLMKRKKGGSKLHQFRWGTSAQQGRRKGGKKHTHIIPFNA